MSEEARLGAAPCSACLGGSDVCQNIDGQCAASWCDCDYQRRKTQETKAQARAEMEAAGVDVAAFDARVRAIVESGFHNALPNAKLRDANT